MTREEFWDYIHKLDIVRQDYIVAIRMRHTEHSEWKYTNELLTLYGITTGGKVRNL